MKSEDRAANVRGANAIGLNTSAFMYDNEEMHIIEQSTPSDKAAVAMDRNTERARIELGLKQAFTAADTDQSGSISVEEVKYYCQYSTVAYHAIRIDSSILASLCLQLIPSSTVNCQQ